MDLASKPYHHGDLRRALLDSYLELLQEQQGWHFSLRDLAKRSGVSHSAAYKHFPDKAGLLAEVAAAGFEKLRLFSQEVANTSALDKPEGFLAICRSYVEFGRTNANLYRVMFSAEAHGCDNQLLKEKGMESLGVLVHAIQEGHRTGWIRHKDALKQAHAVWSQLHGLTVLWLDGLVGFVGGMDPAMDSSFELLLEGLQVS